jgi:hypothetical protein
MRFICIDFLDTKAFMSGIKTYLDLIPWNLGCTVPTTSVTNTVDISVPALGFHKQEPVIRFRALYNADDNVSPSFPLQNAKPQICDIKPSTSKVCTTEFVLYDIYLLILSINITF